MPKKPTESESLQMDLRAQAPAFDVDAFDDAIWAHGIEFVHYRCLVNPIGMVDRFDSRRPDGDHSGSSNNLLYDKAGCFRAIFTGNSKQIRAMEGGILNAARAQITATRCYENNGDRVYFAPMDRLYLKEESVLVTTNEMVNSHESGTDTLKFPACQVHVCVDANKQNYKQGVHFDLVDGRIIWRAGRGPGINTETGRGMVYAVRYLYRPHWYIDQLVHEVRLAQNETILGDRRVEAVNQAAIINREHVYLNEDNDELADPSRRQVKGPEDGGFGPR